MVWHLEMYLKLILQAWKLLSSWEAYEIAIICSLSHYFQCTLCTLNSLVRVIALFFSCLLRLITLLCVDSSLPVIIDICVSVEAVIGMALTLVYTCSSSVTFMSVSIRFLINLYLWWIWLLLLSTVNSLQFMAFAWLHEEERKFFQFL